MQTLTILRQLWRLRLLVAVMGLIALAISLTLAYKVSFFELESRKYSVGISTVRILVDTPDSQVVEIAPKGSEALGVRANLLANLMVEGEIKALIAERAGLRPDQLEGVSETSSSPVFESTPDPRGHVLTTNVIAGADGERLPIIEIEAQAPDAQKAANLAIAAVDGLRGYLDTKAASEQVRNADRLRLSALGAPLARDVVRGPRLAMAVGIGLFVFIVGCAAILGLFALIDAWREAERDKWRYEDVRDELAELEPDAPKARDVNGNGHRPRPGVIAAVPPPEAADEPVSATASHGYAPPRAG
jgi:hypothetical protein